MPRCLVALGSNVGPRQQLLDDALHMLQSQGERILARSPWFRTLPVGGPAGQEEFLNGVALVETWLEPVSFARLLWRVEDALGRKREVPWGARTLDLDLLLYEQHVITTPELTLPHPRMTFRRFVLEPAATIAGEMQHPVAGCTIGQLLEHLNRAEPYLAIAGPADLGAQLASELGERLGGEYLSRANLSGFKPGGAIPFRGRRQPGEGQTLEKYLGHAFPRWLITDFWIPLLSAEEGPGASELAAVLPAPKLLVVLTNSSEAPSRYRFAGPQLALDTERLSAGERLRQVLAAVEAMKPL